MNETAPLNGSLRCVPSTGPLTRSVTVHRPRAGVRRKNCIVWPKFDSVGCVDNAVGLLVDGLAIRIDEVSGELVARICQTDAQAQRWLSARDPELIGEALACLAGRAASSEIAGERSAAGPTGNQPADRDRDASVRSGTRAEVQLEALVTGLAGGTVTWKVPVCPAASVIDAGEIEAARVE